MKDRTRFRLAMLKNGFQPTLNDCKRPIEKGWPRKIVDEAEILRWDRSAYASTGLKIDGDLGAFDVDVPDEALVAQLADALDRQFPELFAHGLVRHAGASKEAWLVRVETPFRRLASRKWYRPGENPETPNAVKYQIECFGSLGARQISVDGPHSRDRDGKVISIYQFAGGASPATTARATLPVLPQAVFAAACDVFDEIAKAAGFTVGKTMPQGARGVVYDLTDDMVFEGNGAAYCGLAELAAAWASAQHQGCALRVASSFLGHGTNTNKCAVGYSKGGRYVFVHDFETGLTHKPAHRAAPVVFELLGAEQ